MGLEICGVSGIFIVKVPHTTNFPFLVGNDSGQPRNKKWPKIRLPNLLCIKRCQLRVITTEFTVGNACRIDGDARI